VATREQVLELVRRGADYEDIADRLGIDPGLAYLLATGKSADGSAAPPRQPVHNPTVEREVLEWVARRVEADAPMRAAGAVRRRQAAVELAPDGEDDVVALLTRDHSHVKTLLRELVRTHATSDAQVERRRVIVAALVDALPHHEAAEDAVFWPAVRELLDDGVARADDAARQQRQAADALDCLAAADATADDFDTAATDLAHAVRAHVAFAEQVFRALCAATTDAARAVLGAGYRAAARPG
jgi:hypothetical protein